MTRLLEQIKLDEGTLRLPNGRHKLYQDTLGIWTVGYGYNIQANGLEEDIAELLLEREVARTIDAVNTRWPWVIRLTEQKRNVLYNMAYNLGVAGLSNFKKFLGHMESARWKEARAEMLDSRWATQVKGRAVRLANDVWPEGA